MTLWDRVKECFNGGRETNRLQDCNTRLLEANLGLIDSNERLTSEARGYKDLWITSRSGLLES